jgi:hypothetical protein
MEREYKDGQICRLDNTGEICFVRFRLERPPVPEGISKEHDFSFAQWNANVGTVIIHEVRDGLWCKSWRLKRSVTIHDCRMHYRVWVGKGKETLANVDEDFYFASLPPEVAKLATNDDRLNGLAQWVSDLIMREDSELSAQSQKREKKRSKKHPPQFSFEQSDVDHHANQREVLLSLLKKEWPRFSAANAELREANSEEERHSAKTKVFHAYIADHQALVGTRPQVRAEEAVELMQEDDFFRLISEAMAAPLGTVDKLDWQLAQGWIDKDYYRMNEAKFADAFARDWGYTKPMKGNTLARRARTLGLKSALKRGRPNARSLDDSALEIRKT